MIIVKNSDEERHLNQDRQAAGQGIHAGLLVQLRHFFLKLFLIAFIFLL